MTPHQALTATLDELRDWCAGDSRWHKAEDGMWYKVGEWPTYDHPYPRTLDGADAAMPEGWDWWKVTAEWAGQAAHTPMIRVPDTGNKVLDLYRLAVLCRLASKTAR